MYILYSLRLAIQSVWHEKWINLLSVLTIAAGLFMITLTFFSVYNMDLATKKLPEKFSMMLYLNNDLSEHEVGNIMSTLKKNNAVERARYISKDKALEELRGVLKNADYVLEGINENPLPASIEVKLRQESVSISKVKKLAADIRKIKGIEEVEYGEQFLNSIHSIKAGAQTLGLLMISIMSTGVIFVCYSTVKIMFYRRKEEIETFKLLGATRGFIRAPFVIEGGILGIGGGVVSLIGTMALYYTLFYKLALTMPIFKIIVFPSEVFIALPFVGLALGVSGAVIALGRIRFS
ncbi:MAG: permease-like cell division protein FtsX [Thermodesulfovibrionales bacterium]|nr:permease-like cell division protein FtsX [Thermodesulfovibrionales bacterium]MDP3111349.1 permease-like cell division protein FtsX [Thermodesulfovibrionales bacterium]